MSEIFNFRSIPNYCIRLLYTLYIGHFVVDLDDLVNDSGSKIIILKSIMIPVHTSNATVMLYLFLPTLIDILIPKHLTPQPENSHRVTLAHH